MAKRYSYRLKWSSKEKAVVAEVIEFPELRVVQRTYPKALRAIQKLVSEHIVKHKQMNKKIPSPLSERDYNGQISLRMTPELHQKLSYEAAEQGVSLNNLINRKLESSTS